MSNGMELQLLNVREHQVFLQRCESKLARWVTSGIKPDALIRFALQDLATNEKLLACTPTSIYLSLLACAVAGLEPGPLKGEAYLVPFNNKYKRGGQDIWVSEATFMAGWRGIKRQGTRAGINIISHVVCENDEFDFDQGSKPFVHLKPPTRGPRGALRGAIAFFEPRSGGLEIEWMGMEDIDRVRKIAEARGGSPAWRDWPDQMSRKSVLKRLGKRAPMNADYYAGALVEAASEDGHSIGGVLDLFTDGDASAVANASAADAVVFHGTPPANTKQADAPASKRASRPTQPTNSNVGSGSPVSSSSPAPSGSKSTQAASGSGTVTAPANTTSSTAPPNPTASPSAEPSATEPKTGSSPTTPTASSLPRLASVASPAASSSSSSASSPSASTPSVASSADGNGAEQGDDFGDVAAEPSLDEAFDDSFGGEEMGAPTTRHEFVDAFRNWADQHPTRASIVGDPKNGMPADDGWIPLFQGWTLACSTQAELDEHKGVFQAWSRSFLSSGRKADPAKSIEGEPADPQTMRMRQIFNARQDAVK